MEHSKSRGRQVLQSSGMERMVARTVEAPFVSVLKVGPVGFPDRFGVGYERKKVNKGQLQGIWPEQLQGWTCH